MDITDIVTNPQYWPYFAIWASGYLAVYSLFSDSNKWREWDTTIKFLYSVMMGICLELCIVLPIYFLNFNNLTLDINEILSRTWLYPLVISGILTYALKIIHNKNLILNFMKVITNKVLPSIYFIVLLLNVVFSYEYDYFYNSYIIEANQKIVLYFAFNMFFSMIGLGFILYFNMILDDLYFNPPGYKKYIKNNTVKFMKYLLLNLYLLKSNISHIMQKKSHSYALWFIPIMLVLIIPVDSTYHILTPEIILYENTTTQNECETYFIVESNFSTLNNPPHTKISFLDKTRDTYMIHSGPYDRLNQIHLPLNENKEISLEYDIDSLHHKWLSLCVDIDPSIKDVLVIEKTSNQNENYLDVGYKKLDVNKFNISKVYWKNIEINDIVLDPFPLEIKYYNETHDNWIQKYKIINNSEYTITIGEIIYLRFERALAQKVDKESLLGYWNNNEFSAIWCVSDRIMYPALEIKSGETTIFGFSFHIQERYLS